MLSFSVAKLGPGTLIGDIDANAKNPTYTFTASCCTNTAEVFKIKNEDLFLSKLITLSKH